MAAKIQFRRDTAANWASVNPILSQGEIGQDTSNSILKIGDGIAPWDNLPTLTISESAIDTKISDLVGGAPGALDTLNELAEAINDDASYASTVTTALGTKTNKTSNQSLSSSTDAMTISDHTITLTRGDGSTDVVTIPDNNTTYSVQDGELSEKSFTSAEKTKLGNIEDSATADQSASEIKTAYESNTDTNEFSDAEQTKLDGIEASADVTDTANVVASLTAGSNVAISAGGTISSTDTNTTYSVGDGGLSEINFTSADHSKLNGIEALADVTDVTNVTAAGALMDSEVTNLAAVKAFATTDYATAAQGTTANAALPKAGGAMTGAITTTSTFDGRDVATDGSKLDLIEASADVTDTANVVAALSAGTGVTISGAGVVAVSAVALTTVQTAVSQAAQLALTAQEGDVVVRSDENKSYVHNGGTAGTMADYTLLATPTDAVLSVNGVTGAVTAAHIAAAVEAASGSNTFTDADHTKLNAIEASADVTDTTNVTAAGALMDSELAGLAAVKATTGTFLTADQTKLDGIATAANNYVHPTTAGNKHVPTAGAAGQFLKYSASGTAVWAADNNTVYTHPSHPGDDFSVDTGALTGATVVSDIDINVTTDTSGHVTDANGVVSTRTLTLANLGYTGATNANNYSLPSSVVHDTESGALHATDALRISGHTVSLYKGNGTSESVTIPDNNTTYSVGDNGLTQKNFTSTLKTKLDGIASSANNYTHPTTAGNKHVPTGGSSGQFLKYDSSGTAVWAADNNTTYSVGDGGLTQVNFTTADNTKLDGIEASANNYSHPTHPGDDFSVDSGVLSGATVISDIDINVTTDTSGHVTDANGTISTRDLTLANLGYTGATNANYITNNNQLTNGAGYITSYTNTTYSADGNYGMTLSGTAFRLEDDRRRNSTTTDIYSGNTHDYTFYDASHGIRWYTEGAEEMRLENDGDLHVDGDVIAYSTTVSDERLKTGIAPITGALSKVNQLKGCTFTYKADGRKSAGLIAQDVEKVLPSAVSEKVLPFAAEDEEMYKTVQYDQTIGLLVEAIKELSAKVEELENK